MNFPEDLSSDQVIYLIVSTGYENNFIDGVDLDILSDFMNEHNIEDIIVLPDEDLYSAIKRTLYRPNFDKGMWIPEYSQDEVMIAKKAIEVMKQSEKEEVNDTLIIFKLPEDIGYMDSINNSLKIVANLETLDFCHFWSIYDIDFRTMRDGYHAVIVKVQAEAG